MSFLQSINTSASGLTVQKLRMDIASENIANVNTTRTEGGGPYKRKLAVLASTGDKDFGSMVINNMEKDKKYGGVEVQRIVEDETEGVLVYDPQHPDSDENGYVEMPNVDTLKETADMMEAYRAYEANITALNSIKQMAVKTLEIGR